ncbi:MAG: ABC transporter substrate-binding protein, partial [Ilumatobacteraceae bacterium]
MRRVPRSGHRVSGATRAAAVIAALALVAAACGDSDDEGDEASDTAPASTVAPAPDDDTEPESDDSGSGESDDPEPDDATDADTSDDDGSDDETPATTAATDEPADDEPQQGGELIVATLFDSFGFDPVKVVGGIADGTVAGAVFEGLMTYDEDANVVPWLAESLESDDFQTWTLGLRPGVVFSDGTPVDAEAVKYNLERHQDVSLLSRGILNALNMEEITVVDDTTLEIRLRFPWPAFPETLVGPLGIVGSPTPHEAD